MRTEYEEVYGARKMWLELNRRGFPVARCTVERVMREHGLRGARRGRKVRTTIPGKGAGHERAPDLIGRDFTAPVPNRRWVADFTQVATLAGTVYVAFVVDIFSRLFAGWAAARPGGRLVRRTRRGRMKGGGMRRPDFLTEAAALQCGRRDGTGPPPPASTVLRIALARDGLRPPLTPETSGGPQGQQSGQPKGMPRSGRGALPAARGGRWPVLHPAPNGGILEHDSPPPGHKRTLVRLRQQAERLQG